MFRRSKESSEREPRHTGWVPGWDVPPSFAFPRDVVDAQARDPVRLALVAVGADGTVDSRTFADMARESVRWARLLAEHAPEPGSRVVVALEPGTHWAASILGALRVGLLPVPIGARPPEEGLAERLAHLEPSIAIVDHRSEQLLVTATRSLATRPNVLRLDEAQWALMRAGDLIPQPDHAAESPALIVSTSGRRSGRRRPVLHRHTASFATYVPARDWLAAGPGDLVWGEAGTGGDAASLWISLFGPWSMGAAVMHLDPDVSAEERVELLERFQPTVAAHTPESLTRLVDLIRHADLRLTRLRNVVSSGATLSATLRSDVLAATRLAVLDGYATAETGILAFQPFGYDARPGSIGVPTPGHVVAPIDEMGYVVPVGTVGDLAVFGRPPSLCASYWTGWPPVEEVTDDSWTLTGDRAFTDQDGSIHLDDTTDAGADETSLLWRQAPAEPSWELITLPPNAGVSR